MSDPLVVYFAPGEYVYWCRQHSEEVAHGVVQDALADAGDSDLIVVLPGESVLLAQVELPPIRQASRRLQATRYALEEQLASPVDKLHFALGPRTADGASAVAVLDDDYLREILETFGTARRQIVAMVVDVMCQAQPEPEQATLRLIDDRALVRASEHRGFACEIELLGTLLAAAGLKQSALEILHSPHHEHEATIERLRDNGFTVNPKNDAALAWLGQVRPQTAGINLLQGAYAPTNAMDDAWRPLRLTAALAGVWLICALAIQVVNYLQLNQQHAELQASAETRFREAFPEVQNVNNIRVQAEQKLRALRGSGASSGFFPLLDATAQATSSAEGLKIQSLQFRDGGLSLSLRGENIQTLEALRSGFARQSSAQLDVESADAASDGVQIRARVTGAGA